ncbi:MAG TPA: winged helix-turn-helix domain-containing protein [Steroidobacteraceae bacterium]
MSTGAFHLGPWRVEPDTGRLLRGAERVDLEPKTMAVLVALAARPGEVVSGEELLRSIWRGRPLGDNPLYHCMMRLRRALGDDAAAARYIETIPRRGYRLLAEVAPLEAAPDCLAEPVQQAQPQSAAEMPELAPADTADVTAAPLPLALPPLPPDAPASPRPARRGALLGALLGGLAALALIGYLTLAHLSSVAIDPETILTAGAPARPLSLALDVTGRTASGQSAADALRARLTPLPNIILLSKNANPGAHGILTLSGEPNASAPDQLRLRFANERGELLWADTLDMDAASLWSSLDAVATVVQVVGRAAQHGHPGTHSLAALQSYIRARAVLRTRAPGYAWRARELAEAAIREDPQFAAAYAVLAKACGLSHSPASEAEPACERTAIARALELDPELAEAHAAKGLYAIVQRDRCNGDCADRSYLETAVMSLKQAIALDPELLDAHIWLAIVAGELGDYALVLSENQIAVGLDPLDVIANANLSGELVNRGRFSPGFDRMRALARLRPVPFFLFYPLIGDGIWFGRFDESLSVAKQAHDRHPDVETAIALSDVYFELGRPEEAQRVLLSAPLATTPDRLSENLTLRTAMAYRSGGRTAVGELLAALDQQSLVMSALRDGHDRDLSISFSQTLLLSGDCAGAVGLLERVFGTDGEPSVRPRALYADMDALNSLAWCYQQIGRSERASVILRAAGEWTVMAHTYQHDRHPGFALIAALSLALAGHHAESIAALEQAARWGWSTPDDVRMDPRWQSALSDDRSAALLRELDIKFESARNAALAEPLPSFAAARP